MWCNAFFHSVNNQLSQCMRFPTMWYVRPAKPQTSLRIRAVWSEPLLVAWIFYDCLAAGWTPVEISKLWRRLQRLVRVYTCQNVKLLEISCRGSISIFSVRFQPDLQECSIRTNIHPSVLIKKRNAYLSFLLTCRFCLPVVFAYLLFLLTCRFVLDEKKIGSEIFYQTYQNALLCLVRFDALHTSQQRWSCRDGHCT